MKVTVMPIVIGALGTIPKDLLKEAKRVRNRRMIGDHLNYGINIGQNTEMSPGNLRKLPVTQTQGKDHQLTPM